MNSNGERVPCVSFPRVSNKLRPLLASPTRRNPHQVLLGPSRSGKDYFVRYGLLGLYPAARIVVFATKRGDDDTWDGWGNDVTPDELPLSLDPGGGELPHWRVRQPPGLDDDQRARQAARLLADLRQIGHVVLVLSDAGSLTEPRARTGLGLGGAVAGLMAEGASNRLSVIACVNSRAWSESGLRTQAKTFWLGSIPSDTERRAFADTAGVPEHARPQLATLAEHEFMLSDTHQGAGSKTLLALTGIGDAEVRE